MTARRAVVAGVVVMVSALAWTSPGAAVGTAANSAAVITGAFDDSCRDFVAESSKDISHVESQYVDGRVIKDEVIDNVLFARDGTAGDELLVVTVKSGITEESFPCTTVPQAVCSDGLDNDGNGLTDYPDDPGCFAPEDNDEGWD